MRYRIEIDRNTQPATYYPQYSDSWIGGWNRYYALMGKEYVKFHSWQECSGFLSQRKMALEKAKRDYADRVNNISYKRWP